MTFRVRTTLTVAAAALGLLAGPAAADEMCINDCDNRIDDGSFFPDSSFIPGAEHFPDSTYIRLRPKIEFPDSSYMPECSDGSFVPGSGATYVMPGDNVAMLCG